MKGGIADEAIPPPPARRSRWARPRRVVLPDEAFRVTDAAHLGVEDVGDHRPTFQCEREGGGEPRAGIPMRGETVEGRLDKLDYVG